MKFSKEEKLSFMNMSLDEKIKRTKQLIMEWNAQFDGKVVVSFSGGKDSTVLLHIVRHTLGCENIPGVYDDTGLEYPEIREFVKTFDNIYWIRPKKSFYQVVRDDGWPIISKEYSRYIHDLRNPNTCEKIKNIRLNGTETGRFKLPLKWRPLIDADFKISNKCCDIMKKGPLKKFEKETGLKPMIATMAEESQLRLMQYMMGDCNEYKKDHPVSKPMSFWTEQDVLHYIKRENIPIASVYGEVVEDRGKLKTTGVHRTGCMFCMYGLHLEPKGENRFDKMKITHPKMYDYIMNKLGGRHVMEEYLACNKRKKRRIPDLFWPDNLS